MNTRTSVSTTHTTHMYPTNALLLLYMALSCGALTHQISAEPPPGLKQGLPVVRVILPRPFIFYFIFFPTRVPWSVFTIESFFLCGAADQRLIYTADNSPPALPLKDVRLLN